MIVYKKAHDMVPQSLIVECLGVVGVSEQIKHFFSKSMKAWKVDLTCNNQFLDGVVMKREIFQGYSLSSLLFVLCLIPLTLVLVKSEREYQFLSNKDKINHLLFMDDLKLYAKKEKSLNSLVHTLRTFSEDIGIEFSINEYATLVLREGKTTKFVGISLPNGIVMKGLIDELGCKYLNIILQAYQI